MATITLSIPNELKKRMEKTPIKWSEILRNMIITKVKQLKRFEELVQKNKI